MGYGDGASAAGEEAAGLVELGLQEGVVVGGVVVGDEPALDAAEVGEDAGVADGAVAPADFLGVFFVGVLGFVDEDVGAADEIEEREVGEDDFALAGEFVQRIEVAFEELVVGDPDDLFAFELDLVAEGVAGMIDANPRDFDAFDVDGLFVQVVELEVGAHVLHLDGEILAVELPFKYGAEGLVEVLFPVDLDLPAGGVGGGEKGKALDVVPMGVGDEKVEALRRVGHEFAAKFADAGAGVEDELQSVVEHGEAGGVAAVADEATAGRGRRTACSPKDEITRRCIEHGEIGRVGRQGFEP